MAVYAKQKLSLLLLHAKHLTQSNSLLHSTQFSIYALPGFLPVPLQIYLISCRLCMGCSGHVGLLGSTDAGKRSANPAVLSRWQNRVQRKLRFIPQFIQVGSISLFLSQVAKPCLKNSPWTKRGTPSNDAGSQCALWPF